MILMIRGWKLLADSSEVPGWFLKYSNPLGAKHDYSRFESVLLAD